ncbi:hypothetical protein J8I87_40060 [Paraburkholderia sp. LEh10]|nr:hypothetical protein [Paraburkholderia sp. LEh10]
MYNYRVIRLGIISLTDPVARWTAAPAFYACSTNYLIDLKAGIIVDVEATSAYRTQEVDATRTMIARVERRFRLKPQRVVGDTAYGTASMLAWMINDKAIEPHVTVRRKGRGATRRSGTAISSGSGKTMSIAVPPDRHYTANGVRSRIRART